MTDFVKITDYAAKDALLTGNPAKLVKGVEIGADFDAVAVAVATKHDAADIGVTVQAYSANLDEYAAVNPTAAGLAILDDATASDQLTTLGVSAFAKTILDDATASDQLTTLGVSAFAKTILDDADEATFKATVNLEIGTDVQAYDVDTAKLDVDQSWTGAQRGTVTTSNTITAIDLSTTNNHISTPSAGAALTFTNLTAGQAGTIEFVNGSNYAITAGSGTKVTSTFLATISATGTYIISYYVNSAGTAVHCSTGGASA